MNREVINLMLLCAVLLMACGFLGGCSTTGYYGEKINCLDFAKDYAEISGGKVIFGLYRPNTKNYHVWVERKDGLCMDQMNIFDCDDSRYKAIVVPSIDDMVKLMGSRV